MGMAFEPGAVPPGGSAGSTTLVLGTAEWDAPIATNQHFVVRELAQSGPVTFVESLGLRRPTLRRDDLARMASRVGRAFSPRSTPTRRPRPEGVNIVSPLVVPLHRRPTRVLNRSLLRRATAGWISSSQPRVLWTFTPVTYGLETAADVVVYHCVDLLAEFPGVDGVAVGRGERSLAKRANLAIATSAAVEEHLSEAGFERIRLLPNVADVTVFNRHSRPADERRPDVLFAGNLSVHKIDVPLLEAIAVILRGRGRLLLAGPLAAGGGSFHAELARLISAGATYLGMLTQEQLAGVAGRCRVGLIPYVINDYTRGVSPLKCYEYLSSGLAVLSTALPAVAELAQSSPDIRVVDGASATETLDGLLHVPDEQVIRRRMSSAESHGWQERGRDLRELLRLELLRP